MEVLAMMNPRLTLIASLLLSTPLLFAATGRAGDGPKPLRIHIIAGGEYDPVPSMTATRREAILGANAHSSNP